MLNENAAEDWITYCASRDLTTLTALRAVVIPVQCLGLKRVRREQSEVPIAD